MYLNVIGLDEVCIQERAQFELSLVSLWHWYLSVIGLDEVCIEERVNLNSL
jgi:hypothetical protein